MRFAELSKTAILAALVAERVRTVLERARRAKRVRVRVHPSDLAHLEGAEWAAGASIEGDAELTPGDCVVETELGTLDGRVQTQLAALDEALSAP